MENSTQLGSLKILFVDDEENVLRSLKRLFVDEPYTVFIAPSGKEGLELLKTNDIAVIISDQRMPEMSGAEFLEQSKQLAPDAVRLVLTGYADVNAAVDAINKGGAHRYITKPWSDHELIATVREAGERYHLIKENQRLTELTQKQNEELKKWSSELEYYVQLHTIDLSKKNKALETLNQKLNANLKDFITAFSDLIELRNSAVHSHSNSVALLSEEIAKRMGLEAPEIETIHIAAQLHDIGKIGTSDITLVKAVEEFSSEEMAEYMKHPVRGQAAVDTIEDLRQAGILIRHHHEAFDGSGFPDRLKGTDIPLGARIIAIADKFDRLIHGYAGAFSAPEALDALKPLLGVQFDRTLYDPLVMIVKEKAPSLAPARNTVEIEVRPKDLKPGMVISRDVRSGTGLLLLKKGAVLNENNIETLRRGYHIDPSKTGIFVWVNYHV